MEGQTKAKQGAMETHTPEPLKNAARGRNLTSTKNSGKQLNSKQFEIEGHKVIVVFEKELEEAAAQVYAGLEKASKLLKSENDIVVIISSTEDKVVGEMMDGVNGYTPNGHHIMMEINTKAPHWKDFVMPLTLHEFNHLIRFQRIGSMEKFGTILTGLAWEGLAQCFEESITDNARPWSLALEKDQARKVWERLKNQDELNSGSRDLYRRLFLAPNDPEFKHWSGYSLGYLIIKAQIEARGGSKVNWEKLIEIDSATLVGDGLLVWSVPN